MLHAEDVYGVDSTCLVRTVATNTSDHDDAPSPPETLHLPASRLSGKERPVHVHIEDLRYRPQRGHTSRQL